MFTNPSKYYTRYNRNIKGIKGSGVVTPRPPKDSCVTTGTVKETLVDDIEYMPPLYLRTWDNDKQNTNGYLNEKDYVDYVPDIDKYYYTTQQMDNVIVKDRSISSKLDNSNYPIKLPPPLVTTKNKINIKDYNIQKDNSILEKESEYGIGQNEINRNWYDGRYLYTFSPSSLQTIYPWTNYKLIYPFNNQIDTLKYYQDLGVKNITKNALLRSNKNNSNFEIENFDNSNNTIKCFQNYNILYLTILCILIVIYFIRSKK